MSLLASGDLHFLQSVADLAYTNPFLPERIDLERDALQHDFVPGESTWSASVADPDAARPNVALIYARLERILDALLLRFQSAADIHPTEVKVYQECVHYLLYQRYYSQFVLMRNRTPFYPHFAADWAHYHHVPGTRIEPAIDPTHLFACFRQVRRAFHHIFDNIIGTSMPASRLRASVWQSIFTHDMRRYLRTMHARMGDFPTLITGPSGTGKELVARAIAGSRYIPFHAERMEFAEAKAESFFAINLAALSPTLVESELFGHRRGSFTGAIADRKGWLESCPASGSVFLDELGEMDLSIQVKILRVMETRKFSTVGDTATREFRGKLIAATNRELSLEIHAGRFREDLYYRLCADQIRTPSLREQISEAPGVLREILLHMVRRAVGDEAEQALPEVERWIAANLPSNYPWPGNYREVEQCVRNILIHGWYQPMEAARQTAEDAFYTRFRCGEWSADEVLEKYAAQVYQQAGSYEEAARRLGLDRRTVRAKVQKYLKKE
ncbi:MAG: sigma 54-interacting transcriptional regulator [Bryobacteraceae bacterium]